MLAGLEKHLLSSVAALSGRVGFSLCIGQCVSFDLHLQCGACSGSSQISFHLGLGNKTINCRILIDF